MAVKNSESGFQALAQPRGRAPELLEPHRLGEEVLIEKYLKPLLEAAIPIPIPTEPILAGSGVSLVA